MGFFDFLKPKKNKLNEQSERIINDIFPKGRKDIDSVMNELLLILNNKIGKKEAETIATKSVIISRISQDFDKDRLKVHLAGYCIQHFSESQISKFFDYLTAIKIAKMIQNRTPSEIRRKGDGYVW